MRTPIENLQVFVFKREEKFMRLDENRIFHATSVKLAQSALYNYANEDTREGIITDIFSYLRSADYEALSKQTLSPVTLNLSITQNEFKEVSGIIKKGCRNYNLTKKYIVEMCIVLAIKALHKNGSLYISKRDLKSNSTSFAVVTQQPYIKMLKCKIEPKYDKLSPSDLVTMAIKYVIKNKFDCMNMLQKHVSMTDKNKEFLKDLYSKNRDSLKDFDHELCKILKIGNNNEYETSNISIYSWIVDEFIIRYYKLNRSVFVIGKVIEKEEEKDPLPLEPESKKIYKQEMIPDPNTDKLAYAKYMSEKMYGKEKEEENVIEEIDGKVNIEGAIEEPTITNSSDVNSEDDWIMMKIFKLRRQLKHIKLELIIKDKE